VLFLALVEADDRNCVLSRTYCGLSLFIGGLYVILSISQFLEGGGVQVPLASVLNIAGDMAAGFVLFITGILLIAGGVVGFKGERDGSGYIVVGYFMGLFLAGVHLLIILSDSTTASLTGEESVDMEFILGGIVPGLYMLIPLLFLSPPVFGILRQIRTGDKEEAGP
jgi:hypothetical protein